MPLSERNSEKKPMFKLEITSIEEFLRFIKIIRGEEDEEKAIKAATALLNKEANKLKTAVDNSKGV